MSDKPKLRLPMDDLREFADQLAAEGVEPRHIKAAKRNRQLMSVLSESVADVMKKCLDSFSRTFPVKVDRSQTIEDLIAQLKAKNWQISLKPDVPDLNKNKNGVATIKMGFAYVHPFNDCHIAISELYKRGLRLATAIELFSFALQYPDFKLMGKIDGPVVAFGQSWKVQHNEFWSEILSPSIFPNAKIITGTRCAGSLDYLRHPVFVAGVTEK